MLLPLECLSLQPPFNLHLVKGMLVLVCFLGDLFKESRLELGFLVDKLEVFLLVLLDLVHMVSLEPAHLFVELLLHDRQLVVVHLEALLFVPLESLNL